MKELRYQQEAIRELTDKTIRLLNMGGTRHKLVFKAPTGGGKTVMACQALAQIVDDLRDRGDSKYQEVAFIWFAPRKLHLQSYSKLRFAYEDNRQLTPVMFDEIDQAEGLQPGEILFVNWESVNKDSNIMARDSESSASIFEVARRTREESGLPIVVIIDEEHLYWTKTADNSKQVLDRIDPAVEIRISATPKTQSDYKVTVDRQSVIDAEMIKKEVVLNPNITSEISDERTLNEHLIETALRQRQHLAEAYKAMGSDINPLLLIQLPNDTSEKMTSDDEKIAEVVKTYLRANPKWHITPENGKLAVWLAGEKCNLPGIEEPDNMVQVLLFKEAIALGWDCPRAAVLLIFRKLQSDVFTIQTVGRILRMPEQVHYRDESLNVGYVYTDIAKDKIQIIADQDYFRKDVEIAYRRENLANVTLASTYSERPNAGRNYLGPDFKEVLFKVAEKFFNIEQAQGSLFSFAELAACHADDDYRPLPETDDEQINENRRRALNKIRLNVQKINAEIPADVHFQNEEQILTVNQVKYARTVGEINRVFTAYINGKGGQFEAKGRTDKISSYLLELMSEFFGLFETDAKKVVLYRGSATQPNNRKVFDRLLDLALSTYAEKRKRDNRNKPARIFTDYMWEVPEERAYDSDTHHTAQGEAHALTPFYELNEASAPEKKFATYLEQHRQFIDWWYKNGDNGKQHYAIRYQNSADQTALFYVDFVIRAKSGKIYLFDTKGAGGDLDSEVVNKHNALIDYIAAENAKGGNLHGGVIKVDKYGNWLYCQFKIDNAEDLSNWTIFEPRNA
ncbi:MAG: DEAD/DEAH box helicase family protein [Muribaculaceae bacterium]|nr:DEAD/DEAH box helicase family protein [Muribaculaceae bacterium]